MWQLRWSHIPHRSLHQAIASDVHLACSPHLPLELTALVAAFHNQQLVVKVFRQLTRQLHKYNCYIPVTVELTEYRLESVAAHPATPEVRDRMLYRWWSDVPNQIITSELYMVCTIAYLADTNPQATYLINDFAHVASTVVVRPSSLPRPIGRKRRAVGMQPTPAT
jgi:hypothetical protein